MGREIKPTGHPSGAQRCDDAGNVAPITQHCHRGVIAGRFDTEYKHAKSPAAEAKAGVPCRWTGGGQTVSLREAARDAIAGCMVARRALQVLS